MTRPATPNDDAPSADERARRRKRRRHNDPELALARKAKRAGFTKSDYIDKRTKTTMHAAKVGEWRRSELAAALADIHEAADLAYDRGRR